MQQRVRRAQGIPYFNYAATTCSTWATATRCRPTGFGAAGMTFEKSGDDGVRQARPRAVRHASGPRCRPRATHKARRSCASGAASYGEALRAGQRRRAGAERGRAARATRCRPGAGHPVRALLPARRRPGEGARGQALVRRLQRMDVEVRRLTAPLTVPDYTPYGAAPRVDDAAGRHYWIPMAQRAEALGAGDAQRGHLRRRSRTSTTSRLEPAAAVQRRRRPLRAPC